MTGQKHRLGHYRGRIVVINFWSCECPHVERTDSLMTSWTADWGKQVVLLPVASNANELPEGIAAAARERGLPLILDDRQHYVADLYEAETTPHVFVIDESGRLRYGGAVDDTSLAQRVPSRFYLEEAVQALLGNASPRVSHTRPYGCAIIRHALE